MKKIKFVLLSVLFIISLVGCSNQKTITTSNGNKYTQTEIDNMAQANKKLERVLNVKVSTITMVNDYFVGEIQNTNTSDIVSSITLDMGIYDENNNKLGDEYIYIDKIDCGETYKINQKFYDYKYKNAKTFKLVDKQINFE